MKIMKIEELIASLKDMYLSKIKEMEKRGCSDDEIRKVKDECNESIRLSLMILKIDDEGNIIVPEESSTKKEANREIIRDLLYLLCF